MYDVLPSFVLGFHGCDRALAERVFAGKSTLQASENDYDWLGHGIYFWENNPQRALDYARLLRKQPKRSKYRIINPAVVGAIIDLGLCLNLLDAQFIKLLRFTYHELLKVNKEAGTKLPTNKAIGNSKDLLLRHLDCAVIERLHSDRNDEGLASFDSARRVFIEGKPVYPGAGTCEFNHIQICVRNSRCITCYFRVLK